MKPRRPSGARLELVVTSIAAGGDGVAHVEVSGERRAVFVPGSAPGDELSALVDLRTRPARAAEVQLRTPSPDRRATPCPHADACGGCSLMHLLPAARTRALATIVEGSIGRALGGLVAVHHPAPADARYRTRARFAVVSGRRLSVGFHARRDRHVVDVPSCLVVDARVEAVLPILRAALAGARGEGEASVALGADGRAVVDLAWHGELAPSCFAAFEGAVARSELAGVALRLDGVSAPAIIGDATVITTAADGLPLRVPSGGFAQANPAVSIALASHVAQLARTAGRDVVELYAGAGNLTTVLARGAASYVAVEADAPAVAFARETFRERGLTVRLAPSSVDRFTWPRRCDVVVLDPPRTGAKEAIEGIVGARPEDVIYVSCDPQTLARDAALLVQRGFLPRTLHTFDMFPETHHVESVLHFRSAARSPARSPS